MRAGGHLRKALRVVGRGDRGQVSSVVWLAPPRLVEMPKLAACGFFLSMSTRSRPLLIGESARTVTARYSSNSIASGENAVWLYGIRPMMLLLIEPVVATIM